MNDSLVKIDLTSKEEISLVSCDVSSHEHFPERDKLRETRDNVVTVVDGWHMVELCDHIKSKNDHSVANGEQLKVAMEEQTQKDHIGRDYCILNESLWGKCKGHVIEPFFISFQALVESCTFQEESSEVEKKFNYF